MPTLIAGLILTAAAVTSLAVSIWQNGRAQDAGQRAAEASLRAFRAQRAADTGATDRAGGADRAEEERLLRIQRRHATVAYATKRAAIVVLAIGLLGVVGGSLDTFL